MRCDIIGLVAAILGIVASLAAAISARRSREGSSVVIDPGWAVEPGDAQLSQMGWLAGSIGAFGKISEINSAAALWSALAASLSGLAGFLAAAAIVARWV
jgi:hypothetical protein